MIWLPGSQEQVRSALYTIATVCGILGFFGLFIKPVRILGGVLLVIAVLAFMDARTEYPINNLLCDGLILIIVVVGAVLKGLFS